MKAKRPVISPNFNFLGQLLDFEKRIEVRKRDNSDSSAQVSPPIRPQSDNFSIAARHADSLEAFQVKNMRRSFSAPLKVQKSSDRSALRINLASVSPEQKAGRNNKREMADPLESLSDSIQSASISTGERQKSLTVPIANSNLLALQREQTNVQQSCNEPTSSSSSSELETSCCRSQFSNQDQSDFHHHPCCSSCLKIEVAVEEYHFESNTSVANWTLAESFERHISPVRLNRKVDSTTMELSSTQSTLKSRSPSPSLRGVTVPAQHPTSVENPLFRTAVFRSSLKRLRAAQISPANIQPCRDIRAATEAPADTPSHLKSLKRASWPRGPCLEPFSQLKSPDDGFSDGQFADGYGDPEAKDWGSTGSLEITVS